MKYSLQKFNIGCFPIVLGKVKTVSFPTITKYFKVKYLLPLKKSKNYL